MIRSNLQHHTLSPARRSRGRGHGQAGFTLLELMVVVIIIAIVAVMAAPGMLAARRDQRAFNTAATISVTLREARARSYGRGSAVLVRIEAPGTTAQPGKVTVKDDADPLTGNPRVGGCLGTDWSTAPVADTVVVEQDDILAKGSANVALICFAPSGRSYFLSGAALSDSAMSSGVPMTDAYIVRVGRQIGGVDAGLQREVVLMPSGATRVRAML
jgi:type II secretion system protein H